MSRDQIPFRLLLLLGIVAAVVLHSAGALDHADAVRVAELPADVFGGRILALGAAIVDLVDLRYGPFQSFHLAAALFLALAAALSGAVAARAADRA
ncbi:MAG: hypothetical protein HKN12_11305, partial [Gemmatimonadetes bacterium]|nr:hypothetical protein [Gemmatimonadota bacterium]